MPFGTYKYSWLHKEMKLCPCNVYWQKIETKQEEKFNCLASEKGMLTEFVPAAVFLVDDETQWALSHAHIG